MSPAPAVRAARSLIARSDRVFFDTRNLRYIAGISKPENLEPAAVKKLLEEGELKVVAANEHGVITMELSDKAFKRGLANRSRTKGPSRRVDMVQLLGTNASGTRNDDDLMHQSRLDTIIAMPFTGTLFNRFLTATTQVLETYREDPRLVGGVTTTPGHLIPFRATELRDNVLDILSFFEETEVTVMINAANAQYAFGTLVHGYWLGTDYRPIKEFITDTLDRFGKRASNNLVRAAEKLLKDPLVNERNVHPDEGSSNIIETMSRDQGNKDKRGAA